MSHSGYYIGLNSGTSADGVDATLCKITGWQGRPRFLHLFRQGYPGIVDQLYQRALAHGTLGPEEWLRLDRGIALTAVKAVEGLLETLDMHPEDIKATGWHGQTVYHLPEANPEDRLGILGTLQLGNGSVLAQRTGIPVVTDFRSADMAQGGRGAPLTPILDLAFYGMRIRPVITLNLGGIANLSRVGRLVPVRALDVGPANSLLDALARKYFDRPYDPEGFLAAQGQVNEKVLARMEEHPFLARSGPKATGREVFGPNWISHLSQEFSEVEGTDWLATAVEFTVRAFRHALDREGLLDPKPSVIVVSGGGVRNKTLMARLIDICQPVRVTTSDQIGIPNQAREGLLFAHLAWRHISGLPGNLPSVTGAKHAIVLGCYCPVTVAE